MTEPGTPDPGANPDGGAAAAAAAANEPQKYTMDQFRDTEWRASISDEAIRTHGGMADFKSMDDLAKSWQNAQNYISGDKLLHPKTDDKEGWNTLYNKLGRPDKSDAYDLGLPEGSPDNWTGDEFKAFQDDFKTKAFDSGLSQVQVKAMWDYTTEQSLKGIKASQMATNTAIQKQVDESKTEFGANIKQFIATRDAVLNKLGGQEAVDYVRNNPSLNTNKTLIKMFNEVAKNYGEDQLEGPTKGGVSGLTVDAAKSKMRSLMGSDAYKSSQNPSHGDTIAEVMTLSKFVNGG